MKKKISDKERLDWLTVNFRSLFFSSGTKRWFVEGSYTLSRVKPRQAIDAAIRREKGKK